MLDDSQNSLMAIDNDFDYMQSQLDTSGGLWGTEQMLNGDMAVLPVSGVASIMPKLEDIKEDYAKVLTDWQEHIGYLQVINIYSLSINNIETNTENHNLFLTFLLYLGYLILGFRYGGRHRYSCTQYKYV